MERIKDRLSNTKPLSSAQKGDIGVYMVAASLTMHGIDVYHPTSDAKPYDILINYDGCYYRVQVKYRSISKPLNGAIELQPRRTKVARKGLYNESNYSLNKDFDILAIYCPELPKNYDVAYLMPHEYNTSIRLRIHKLKSRSTKCLKFEDFTDINRVLCYFKK